MRRHTQSFRNLALQQMQEKAFGDSARDDLIAKYFQIIKFELEAALKLEDWNAMDDLFQVMLCLHS